MRDDLKWNFYIEKIFDDKLLDGNIVDILFVVDVIWEFILGWIVNKLLFFCVKGCGLECVFFLIMFLIFLF